MAMGRKGFMVKGASKHEGHKKGRKGGHKRRGRKRSKK